MAGLYKSKKSNKGGSKAKEEYIAKSELAKGLGDYGAYVSKTFKTETEKERKNIKAKPHSSFVGQMSAALTSVGRKADTYAKQLKTKLEKKEYPKIGKDY